MTFPFRKVSMPVLIEGIAQALGLTAAEFESRCAALESRLNLLEARTENFEYVGIFQDDREYLVGNFCTSKGAIWRCNRNTRQRPGDGNDWTLACKAGRDGRDA